MTDRSDDLNAAIALFVGVMDLSRAEAATFAEEGFTSVEELAYVPEEELLQVKGLSAERIKVIRERARKCVLTDH
jgi:transcription termination/antitermination protein NusA